MRSVETVLALVVVATVVAAFAKRLRIPAPALLVVAGLVVGLLPGVPPVRVTPDVVSLVVLPPLLYAASEDLPWRDLRAVWRPVTIVAGTAAAPSAGAQLLRAIGEFAVLAGGGALAGGVIAAGAVIVRGRTTDPVLETVVALVTPYAAYTRGHVVGGHARCGAARSGAFHPADHGDWRPAARA